MAIRQHMFTLGRAFVLSGLIAAAACTGNTDDDGGGDEGGTGEAILDCNTCASALWQCCCSADGQNYLPLGIATCSSSEPVAACQSDSIFGQSGQDYDVYEVEWAEAL